MILGSAFFNTYQPKAALRVTGEDAFSFLQGQFSNDLRQPTGVATYGLWLNQKGKVVADSVVLRLAENEFLVISFDSPAGVIEQRLQDYIVADEVNLIDETEALGGLIIGGVGSGEIVRRFSEIVPGRAQFVRKGPAVIFHGYRLPGENYEIIGPQLIMSAWREQLAALGLVDGASPPIERARIAAGIPAIPADIGPADLPNEAGLELSAISFTKGCYLGQEVMARLKNLGQVRRQLQVVRGTGSPPKPQAPLFQGAKKVGELRSVAAEGDGFVALAMLVQLNLAQREGLSLAPDTSPTILVVPHE
jgi:folate-binding protein YgfZ